ncbi:DAK2 domain-containing protein [Streptomyces sp. ME19-01-6]|uniref:DAK2 domain-containing protein n=1 Tax=Streptomyces sp. ME19-01-6 TaxID=3028686 RepID=UPI0029B1FCB0|nr:DAK2 domain-containing protein [Streptomyces sp. ME19-01-6]MDX3229465.1 DAK2 domain-containing protein [Streptomyces sp. ME19-01-6]
MPHPLDADAVRTWCGLALDALGRAREEIDAINVYPVADADTGTNLYLTVESAAQAVTAAFDGHAAAPGPAAHPSLREAVRAMAHGALIGARGNSGTILAQLLRGMADVLADGDGDGDDRDVSRGRDVSGNGNGGGADPAGPHGEADGLRRALRRAAELAYRGVAHPVEGTVLTVARAAADAADRAQGDPAAVARAAYEGARTALEATPAQLGVLARAGVVDAGGYGLVVVLGALAEAVSGRAPADGPVVAPGGCAAGHAATADGSLGDGPDGGPAFEVIYLLEADETAVARLRDRLDALGDSLVVVGGDGLWNVHVHVDDAGAAVEAGIEAGRPHRIRITHFGTAAARRAHADQPHLQPRPRTDDDTGKRPDRPGAPEPQGARADRAPRAVVVVVPGEGLAALCAEAGATTIAARLGERLAAGELAEAVRRARAREVVLLPNDAELRHTAAAAAAQARAEGVRVAVIPTRSPVQGLAALAVHEPGRSFDEDVVAMTSAAGATRYAELAVAERQSWTMAGVCQAGDMLGLIDGDVAVIGDSLADTAETVLDRMLAAGGELVTLVLGADVPDGVAEHLERHVREGHFAVDTVIYHGGQPGVPLIIGIE